MTAPARTVTALVPIKAHSERVPNKNTREFAGKPLFHWVLGMLQTCPSVSRVVVNTDSERIADEAARLFGANVLWRPEHLLGDMIGIQPLIQWDLEHSEGDLFLQTHSTNPLLTGGTVEAAISSFVGDEEHDSLFSVTELHTRLYWPDGRPVNHDPDNIVRTQDLAPILEENSCIYVFPRSTFEKTGHRLGERPLMFPMDAVEGLDIDEPHDWEIAQAAMVRRIGGSR